MTHKHTELHPSPSRSLTSSAPSCESPPPYLQPGLRRAARGSCSSSGACHTARSCPSHGQTASPHSSHICEGKRQQNKKTNTRLSLIFAEVTLRGSLRVSFVACMCGRMWLLEYNFPHRKANLCFFCL